MQAQAVRTERGAVERRHARGAVASRGARDTPSQGSDHGHSSFLSSCKHIARPKSPGKEPRDRTRRRGEERSGDSAKPRQREYQQKAEQKELIEARLELATLCVH